MPYDSEHYTPAVTPSVVEPWRKVLEDAADYIEAHGWCQNRASDGDRVCLLGAIAMVSDATVDGIEICAPGPAYRLASEVMIGNDMGGCWNDTPGRTAADVCAALRDCARS